MNVIRVLLGAAVAAFAIATTATAAAGETSLVGLSTVRPALASSVPQSRVSDELPLATIISGTIDATGTRLTLRLRAAAGNPCEGTGTRSFIASARASGRAVQLTVTVRYAGPPAPLPKGATCLQVLDAKSYEVTLRLAAPLDGKPLVGPDGALIPVSPAS